MKVELLVAMLLIGSTVPTRVAAIELVKVGVIDDVVLLTQGGYYNYYPVKGQFHPPKSTVQQDRIIKKMKIEINFRARLGELHLENLMRRNRNVETSVLEWVTYKLIQNVEDQVVYTTKRSDHSREYGRWSMHSILTRLAQLSRPSSNIRGALDKAIKLSVRLEVMAIDLRMNKPTTKLIELIVETDKQLEYLFAVTKDLSSHDESSN